MSKQSAQLANAIGVADEAIEALASLASHFGEVLQQVEDTCPGHFGEDRTLLDRVDAEVTRLRRELEGKP